MSNLENPDNDFFQKDDFISVNEVKDGDPDDLSQQKISQLRSGIFEKRHNRLLRQKIRERYLQQKYLEHQGKFGYQHLVVNPEDAHKSYGQKEGSQKNTGQTKALKILVNMVSSKEKDNKILQNILDKNNRSTQPIQNYYLSQNRNNRDESQISGQNNKSNLS